MNDDAARSDQCFQRVPAPSPAANAVPGAGAMKLGGCVVPVRIFLSSWVDGVAVWSGHWCRLFLLIMSLLSCHPYDKYDTAAVCGYHVSHEVCKYKIAVVDSAQKNLPALVGRAVVASRANPTTLCTGISPILY